MVAAPIAWVTVEYLRAYFLTGFPWYYLAHSQYRYLHVIQVADITGSLGISLVIAIFNAWLVERGDAAAVPAGPRQIPIDAGPVGAAVGHHAPARDHLLLRRLPIVDGRIPPGPRVALLQSNLAQGQKNRDRERVLAGFEALIRRAVAVDPRPELIVWPETSYPYSFIMMSPDVNTATLKRQLESIPTKISPADWLETRRSVLDNLHGLTNEAGVPMLVGCGVWDHEPDRLHQYNTAVLFRPSHPEIEFYHKIHLVPFGEFIPLIEALPWLASLTPYRDRIPSLSFGKEPRTFEIGPYRYAPAICFEDTIPQVINLFFSEPGQAHQPDILVNLSNDGWYPDSSELDTHLAIGVFRTVEHRVPLVRAVNTGFSALVDGNGEIRSRLDKSKEDLLIVYVPLDDRTTWYSRWGDWLGLSCLAVTIGWIPVGLIRPRRRIAPHD